MQLIGDLDSELSPLGQPVADGLEKNVGGAVETERRPGFSFVAFTTYSKGGKSDAPLGQAHI